MEIIALCKVLGSNLSLVPLADIIAVDLDFTLLDEDRDIPEDNRRAVARAVEAGVSVVLASGRIASGIRFFGDQLGLRSPIISCNGAYVLAADGSIVERHVLAAETCRRAIDFCRERGVHVNCYADDKVYFPEENEWTEMYLRRVRNSTPQTVGWDEMYGIQPQKLIAVASPDTIQAIALEAENLFSPSETALTLSEPEYLEFMSPGCNKGTGLAAVAQALGVPQARTAAIGDYYNDLEMLEWAGISAAVENAPDDVKAVADHVVPQHNRGGVGVFIDLLCVK